MTKSEILQTLDNYKNDLREKEVSGKSSDKYIRDVERLLEYMSQAKIEKADKAAIIAYKQSMIGRYKPVTVNSYLGSLNRYFRWAGAEELTVKSERLQKRYSLDHIMTVSDYNRLLDYAKNKGKWKYYYIMRTLASTGIRVGELRAITVESVLAGKAVIYNKGKIREVYLPDRLCEMLLNYASNEGLRDGYLFTGAKKKSIGCDWNLENTETISNCSRCRQPECLSSQFPPSLCQSLYAGNW